MNVIIKDAVEKSQNDFYLAFKNRMTQIMKDMQKLKEKANVERIKAQQDQKLVTIEKERDWFRAERAYNHFSGQSVGNSNLNESWLAIKEDKSHGSESL